MYSRIVARFNFLVTGQESATQSATILTLTVSKHLDTKMNIEDIDKKLNKICSNKCCIGLRRREKSGRIKFGFNFIKIEKHEYTWAF